MNIPMAAVKGIFQVLAADLKTVWRGSRMLAVKRNILFLPLPSASDILLFTMDFIDLLRNETIGGDREITTPFGKRRLLYADYTASGRGLRFVERYMVRLLELYGNTHTAGNATGVATTNAYHASEAMIKRAVGADEAYHVIPAGTGATGAIHKLQQILGVYIPPAAKEKITQATERAFPRETVAGLGRELEREKPVVFIGPYEHHSNEISWRECFADVVEIDLGPDGGVDLSDLERKLALPEYGGRRKIGSFSAASNVTGVLTPVFEITRILHAAGALAFFDYAASAPYVPIRMRGPEGIDLDGIMFSPHKLIGGPGSCGLLIIHEKIYPRNLAPSTAGGGTVRFVSREYQDYVDNIEERESAGTPGILQMMRAALSLSIKERIGGHRIMEMERAHLAHGLSILEKESAIHVLGDNVARGCRFGRLAILSCVVKSGNAYFHPGFVGRLLNDLFGVQARAGCSCAGPYGHRLFGIDDMRSLEYRHLIAEGNEGIKPGWVRIGFHFLMTEEEVEYICEALRFIARRGKYFLPLYDFDLHTARFTPRGFSEGEPRFGLEEALRFAGDGESAAGVTAAGMDPAGSAAAGPAAAANAAGWAAGPAAAKTEAQESEFARWLAEAEAAADRLEKEYRPENERLTESPLYPYIYYRE